MKKATIFKRSIFNVNIFAMFALLTVFPVYLSAQPDVQIHAVPSKETYAPGDTILLALNVAIPDKYHLYGNPLGPGIGKPFSILLPDTSDIAWQNIKKLPAQKYNPSIGDWVWAYEKGSTFFLQGIIKESGKGIISGKVSFSGLICHTACIPVNKAIEYRINVDKEKRTFGLFGQNPEIVAILSKANDEVSFDQAPDISSETESGDLSFLKISTAGESNLASPVVIPPEWDYSPREQKVEFNLWLALLFGFIAGIILNAMPCVLPVLGIKILSFSQANQGSRKTALLRSLVFSSGILSVFMILASLASFAQFSWGEQFQNPKVLVGIIVLIVIFALWMFDIVSFNVPGSVASLERKSGKGYLGDFFKGIFATVLATPCSGPFLGATLAWTLTQKPIVVFVVFASIGVGMALPYVLLSSSKTLSRLIPKPGQWMKDFKNLMGFVLLGFSVYLLMGLPQDMVISTIGAILSVSFALLIYTRFAPWGSVVVRKIIAGVLFVIVSSSGIYLSFGILYNSTSNQAVDLAGNTLKWQKFSSEKLKQAHAEGKHVIIDFTANWCMNCKFNEVAVLGSPAVKKLIDEKDVVMMKADLTTPNQEIETLMHHLGSKSVPFFALFPGDSPYEPIVMRDILSKKKIVKTLSELSEK